MNPSLKSSLQVQALAAFGFGKGPCSKSAFVWCRGHETKDLSIGVSKLISFISIFSKMSILQLLFQNLCKLWHFVFNLFHQKVSYETTLIQVSSRRRASKVSALHVARLGLNDGVQLWISFKLFSK